MTTPGQDRLADHWPQRRPAGLGPPAPGRAWPGWAVTTSSVRQGRTHPLLVALRYVGRRDPVGAVARIVRLLGDVQTADPLLRVGVLVLLAELLHQAGDLPAAWDACSLAAEAAGALRPRDWRRLGTALLVGADLAVSVRHGSALGGCVSACNALDRQDPPDPDTRVIAAALYAAAVHHTDPHQGYQLLHALQRQTPAGSLLALMLTTGLSAMGGTPIGPRHSRPIALPGGALRPRLDRATVGWLADRIHTRPTHDPTVTSHD